VEYWLARDLQHLLGYAEWRNFSSSAVAKAKTACEVSGHPVADHFVDVSKMVDLGSGSQREILSRNLQARGLEQTFAANVAGILEA
jgi:DNA-damage-inducible protein D